MQKRDDARGRGKGLRLWRWSEGRGEGSKAGRERTGQFTSRNGVSSSAAARHSLSATLTVARLAPADLRDACTSLWLWRMASISAVLPAPSTAFSCTPCISTRHDSAKASFTGAIQPSSHMKYKSAWRLKVGGWYTIVRALFDTFLVAAGGCLWAAWESRPSC